MREGGVKGRDEKGGVGVGVMPLTLKLTGLLILFPHYYSLTTVPHYCSLTRTVQRVWLDCATPPHAAFGPSTPPVTETLALASCIREEAPL